eukprot:COSAG01_NODE_5095_length_4491_cov_3.972450_5_plen_123_part_00
MVMVPVTMAVVVVVVSAWWWWWWWWCPHGGGGGVRIASQAFAVIVIQVMARHMLLVRRTINATESATEQATLRAVSKVSVSQAHSGAAIKCICGAMRGSGWDPRRIKRHITSACDNVGDQFS